MLYIPFESSSRAKKYEIYQILNLKNVQFRRINFFFSILLLKAFWVMTVCFWSFTLHLIRNCSKSEVLTQSKFGLSNFLFGLCFRFIALDNLTMIIWILGVFDPKWTILSRKCPYMKFYIILNPNLLAQKVTTQIVDKMSSLKSLVIFIVAISIRS